MAATKQIVYIQKSPRIPKKTEIKWLKLKVQIQESSHYKKNGDKHIFPFSKLWKQPSKIWHHKFASFLKLSACQSLLRSPEGLYILFYVVSSPYERREFKCCCKDGHDLSGEGCRSTWLSVSSSMWTQPCQARWDSHGLGHHFLSTPTSASLEIEVSGSDGSPRQPTDHFEWALGLEGLQLSWRACLPPQPLTWWPLCSTKVVWGLSPWCTSIVLLCQSNLTWWSNKTMFLATALPTQTSACQNSCSCSSPTTWVLHRAVW